MATYNLSNSMSDRMNFDEWARQDARDAWLVTEPDEFERLRDQIAGRLGASDQDVAAYIQKAGQRGGKNGRTESP